jgi:hypothetical protein
VPDDQVDGAEKRIVVVGSGERIKAELDNATE